MTEVKVFDKGREGNGREISKAQANGETSGFIPISENVINGRTKVKPDIMTEKISRYRITI